MDKNVSLELEGRLRREKERDVGRDKLTKLLEECLELHVVGPVVELLFSALDPDHEGVINVDTLATLAEPLEGPVLEQRLAWLFRMLDTDGSGTIQLWEVVDTFSSLFRAEGLEEEVAVERAETVFMMLDKDTDGDVTEEEFVEGCLEDRDLVAELVGEEQEEDSEDRRPGAQSTERREVTKRRYSDICAVRVSTPPKCALRLPPTFRKQK